MRRVFAFILSLVGGAAHASTAAEMNKATGQVFPKTSYNFILPSMESFNAMSGGQRFMTHADEAFFCLKEPARRACINCEYDCRYGDNVYDYRGGECGTSQEPVCRAGAEAASVYGYKVSKNTATLDGFILPAASFIDNTGNGEWKEYFYRYFAVNGVRRGLDGSVTKASAWSPSLPKICHSGYGGLASLDDAGEQFATGGKPRVFDEANAVNSYQYISGTGANRREFYRVHARYNVVGTKVVAEARPFVYWWSKSSVDGKKCLVPHFTPKGYKGDVDVMAMLSGQKVLSTLTPVKYDLAPCGMLDSSQHTSSGAAVWDKVSSTYKCSSGSMRTTDTNGLPFWTAVDIYLDFPNGGGYKTRVPVRKCFVCV